MMLRTIAIALLLIVNSGTLLTAFYGHSPIGNRTWLEMSHLDHWPVQLGYLIFAIWFFWPIVSVFQDMRRQAWLKQMANKRID